MNLLHKKVMLPLQSVLKRLQMGKVDNLVCYKSNVKFSVNLDDPEKLSLEDWRFKGAHKVEEGEEIL